MGQKRLQQSPVTPVTTHSPSILPGKIFLMSLVFASDLSIKLSNFSLLQMLLKNSSFLCTADY